MSHEYLVIMAGGSGTRFWPKSRQQHPKQFLPLAGDQPLLLQTLGRFEGFFSKENIWISTTRGLEAATQRLLPVEVRILAEPEARNTAPAIYWAAQELFKKDSESVMVLMPSDHHIARPELFLKALQMALEWARSHDDLVTLGVKPSRPETGYGYLQIKRTPIVCSVKRFVEKPSLMKAREYLASGDYLWNAGMFVWKTRVILEAFGRWMPEMQVAWNRSGSLEERYSNLTATSIDYGVMEKAENVVAVPLDCGWNDLGSWDALEGYAEVEPGVGTVISGDCLGIESSGNIVDVSGKLVALMGVENIIIVEHEGVLMVASKQKAQEIKRLVEKVRLHRPDCV